MLTPSEALDEACRKLDAAIDATDCYLLHGINAIKGARANERLKEPDTGVALATFMVVAQCEHARMNFDEERG